MRCGGAAREGGPGGFRGREGDDAEMRRGAAGGCGAVGWAGRRPLPAARGRSSVRGVRGRAGRARTAAGGEREESGRNAEGPREESGTGRATRAPVQE